MTPAADTPDAALRAENARLRGTVDELLAVVADLRAAVARQQAHLDRLVRLTFGRRTERAADLGIIYSVWLDPAVLDVPAGELDFKALFNVNREATAKVIRKAMRNEPDIDWLLAHQETVTHYFHQLGVDGKI